MARWCWSASSPQFTDPDTINFVALARFSSSGVPDATFGTDGKLTFLPGPTPQDGGGGDESRAVLIQPADQKILVAGNWDPTTAAAQQIFLARFDSAGVADPGFGTAGIALLNLPGLTHATAEALVLQADGSIVVAGSAGPSGSSQGIIFRLTSTGTLDPTFATGGDLRAGQPVRARDRFRLHGSSARCRRQPRGERRRGDLVLVKVSGDGVADTGFDADGVATFNVRSHTTGAGTEPSFDVATALAVLSDGRILVTGTSGASESGPNTDAVLVRITASGALDVSYGSAGYAPLADASNSESPGGIAVRAAGDAVIAGIGFFPTQVSPNGQAMSLVAGSFSAGTRPTDVLGDGSISAASSSAGGDGRHPDGLPARGNRPR